MSDGILFPRIYSFVWKKQEIHYSKMKISVGRISFMVVIRFIGLPREKKKFVFFVVFDSLVQNFDFQLNELEESYFFPLQENSLGLAIFKREREKRRICT